MTQIQVPLGVKAGHEQQTGGAKPRLPTKTETDKVLARDGYTCRCCGFTSKKYQRVTALKTMQPSAKEGELITVCSFCEMATELDRAGMYGSGHLIWLPEMTQAELNQVVRALYVARVSKDSVLSKAAERALEVLMARRSEVKKRLGSDDPLLLATALLEQCDAKTYAARANKLEGIRFLPLDRYMIVRRGKDENVFPMMLEYWMSPEGPYGSVPVSEWTALFKEVTTKASA